MLNTVKIMSGSYTGWHLWEDSRYVGFILGQPSSLPAGVNQTLIDTLHLNNFSQIGTMIELEVSRAEFTRATEGPQVRRNGDYLTDGWPQRDTTAKPGVWFESAHGYHNTARLVRLAWSYGMPYSDHDEIIVDSYDTGLNEIEVNGEAVNVASAVIEGGLADQAEQWLNDHIAPEGYYFGSEDGEFGLWGADPESTTTWA